MQSHCLRNKKDSTQRHIKGHKPSTWGEYTKKMPKERNKNKVKIQVRLTNAQGIAPKVLYLVLSIIICIPRHFLIKKKKKPLL